MRALADCLKSYVERYFISALTRDPSGPVRPLLIGPPEEALTRVFALLTDDGASEWQLTANGTTFEIIVLMVGGKPPPVGAGYSRGCLWDYAVTIRNSRQRVLILAAPGSWDNRPESLANTTERLGELGVRSKREDDLLRHLISAIASRLAIEARQVADLFRLIRKESQELESELRAGAPWKLADNLLQATPSTPPLDAACRAVGLPLIAGSNNTFRDSYDVLQTLAHFVASEGLRDSLQLMKATNAAQTHGVVAELEALQNHLAAVLTSPAAFETAPTRYFRLPEPVPAWHDALTAVVLEEILSELDRRPSQERLTLSCTNALPLARPLRGGPFVVASAPELRASISSSTQAIAPSFSRKVDRLQSVPLSADVSDVCRCVDTSPGSHRKPIRFKVEAANHRPGIVDVIVLDTFECGGLVVIRDAEHNGAPRYAARANTWTQELSLSRGGSTQISVFHGARASSVTLTRFGSGPVTLPTTASSHSVSFVEDLEDGDEFEIELSDSAGAKIAAWQLQLNIRDVSEVSNSHFEALIAQHRKRKSTAHAPDTPLNRLEIGSYLTSEDSWKPVVACWSERAESQLKIDWNSRCSLGDVTPRIDLRPTLSPPAPLIAARDAIRKILLQEQRCISEMELERPDIGQLIEDYVRHYKAWLELDPMSACWLDTITLYGAEWNSQAGRYVATEEPIALLLSSLHPLRLGWHAVAQKQLSTSLAHVCPAAGLLNFSQCPDAATLFLADGQNQRPRAFFSLPCTHPHWAVFANTSLLSRPDIYRELLLRLSELELSVQGLAGAFTSQQAQESLSEISRLLAARSTLRVGIVGDPGTASECGQGILEWGANHLSIDAASSSGYLELEVYDTRASPDPSPEQLAHASEITGERVRWFKLEPNAEIPKLDLIIVDQLDTRSPSAATGRSRSALSPACLSRVRMREDFQNASAIQESRVGERRHDPSGMPGLVTEAVQTFEGLATRDAQHTHFRFTPNQDAIGSRLQNAIFLSVTSSQVDPACVIRGAVSQGGYLWDYELPGVLAGHESGFGYYLVAQPTSAMCDAIERAAALIVGTPPDSRALLEEVSRRGIPILKRLASGGSQSRGELGLLLASRFLQDAFRTGALTARLPVWTDNSVHLILPVDPYEALFDQLRRAIMADSSAQRPDLLVVAIHRKDTNEPVSIKITPVEVKFRAGEMQPSEMRDALTQAANLSSLLSKLWADAPLSELWQTCSASLLAQFLDFGFRIYAAPWLHKHDHDEWAELHQQVVSNTLEGTARVTVSAAGRLLVFDSSTTTRAVDLDGDSRPDTAIVSLSDARALLTSAMPSAASEAVVRVLDFSFPDHDVGGTNSQGGAQANSTQTTNTAIESVKPVIEPPRRQPEDEPQENAPGLQAASGSRVPAETRERVRNAFQGFIGNEPAISRLSNDLLRALIERPPHLAKNYLFTGLPSTGKTELARRVARALGLPLIKLDGRGVSSRDKLFQLVNGELNSNNLSASQVGNQVGLPVLEYPPLIIFIDEVHLVPRAQQEALLTMLEAADRTVVLSDHVAVVRRATFLFATTRVSDVDPAFASRCDEIQLREYTEQEVAQILRWKLHHDDWSEDIYLSVARLGRCVPRIAIQLAEALETAILVAEDEKSILAHLDDVRRAREIDGRGLTRMDFEYLSILERAGAAVGEQNILNLMRTVDKDRVLNEIEPFLVRLDFIKHGPRGRELTSAGREYLLAHRAQVPSIS